VTSLIKGNKVEACINADISGGRNPRTREKRKRRGKEKLSRPGRKSGKGQKVPCRRRRFAFIKFKPRGVSFHPKLGGAS